MGGVEFGYLKILERKMRKILFGIGSIILLTMAVSSAEIRWQDSRSYGMEYSVECSSGKIVSILYYNNSGQYHYNGRSYNSLNDAVQDVCN